MDNRIAYIELFGEVLSGVRRPDKGLYWTDLTNWWGLPSVIGEADNIPGGHGRFKRSRIYRDSRDMVLTGHILADTNRELMAVRDRLEMALSEGQGLMTVHTNTYGTWSREVEVELLTIDPDHGREYVKFTVDLIAPDPRRYASPQTLGPVGLPVGIGGLRLPQALPWNLGSTSEGSRLLVTNNGSIPSAPLIKVSGGFSSVTVSETYGGGRLHLPIPVAEGDFVLFDMDARTATLNGADVTRFMTSRQWTEVPAGGTREFRFDVTNKTGDPQMWAELTIGAW